MASTTTELELEAAPQVEDAPTPPRQSEPRAAAWLRPDRVFIVLALLVGLCFAFIAQPESGGDERDHFARAYQIAQGHLFTVKNPSGKTGYGAWFPRGLARDLQTLADVAYKNPDRGAFLDHLGDPAPSGPRVWVDLNNSASYGPGSFVPHIVGIEIGRIFGSSTLVRLWLARVLGLLAYVLIIGAAIRRTPWHPWLFAICGLLPAALGQASTVNADSLTIALSFFVTASALRMTAFPESIRRGDLVAAGVAGALLGLGKPPYLALVLLFAVPAWRNRDRLLKPVLTIVGVTAVLGALWASYQGTHTISQDDPKRWLSGTQGYAFHDLATGKQLAHVVSHPWDFVAVVARTFWTTGWDGFRELFGRMGTWLGPTWLAIVCIVLVAIAARQARVPRTPPIDRTARIWLGAVTVVVGLAVLVIGYTNWNAYGAPHIDAMPARYALPLLPGLLIAVLPAGPRLSGRVANVRAAALAAAASVTLIIVTVLIAEHHLTGKALFFKF